MVTFCIGIVDFMLNGKILLNQKNLFSPNEYKKKRQKKNTEIFWISYKSVKMKKRFIVLNVISIEILNILGLIINIKLYRKNVLSL